MFCDRGEQRLFVPKSELMKKSNEGYKVVLEDWRAHHDTMSDINPSKVFKNILWFQLKFQWFDCRAELRRDIFSWRPDIWQWSCCHHNSSLQGQSPSYCQRNIFDIITFVNTKCVDIESFKSFKARFSAAMPPYIAHGSSIILSKTVGGHLLLIKTYYFERIPLLCCPNNSKGCCDHLLDTFHVCIFNLY